MASGQRVNQVLLVVVLLLLLASAAVAYVGVRVVGVVVSLGPPPGRRVTLEASRRAVPTPSLPAAAVPAAPPAPTADGRLAERVPPGLRAVAVTFVEAPGAERPIAAGERVEVIVTIRKEKAGLAADATLTLLSDVRVLAVTPARPGGSRAGAAGTEPTPRAGQRTAVLAVSPRDAQWLALAQEHGELRLARRGDQTLTQP